MPQVQYWTDSGWLTTNEVKLLLAYQDAVKVQLQRQNLRGQGGRGAFSGLRGLFDGRGGMPAGPDATSGPKPPATNSD